MGGVTVRDVDVRGQKFLFHPLFLVILELFDQSLQLKNVVQTSSPEQKLTRL